MTDNEMLEAMRDLLAPINIRLEKMEHEISGIKHEISGIKHEISGAKHEVNSLRLEMNRGFRKNNDEIQTLVAVLEAKGILPIAK